jgi:hypothetical protein
MINSPFGRTKEGDKVNLQVTVEHFAQAAATKPENGDGVQPAS